MDAITQKLGPYRLDVLLGRGGMGEVFKAWDERLERWVAVKRLRTENASPQARVRFRREARAAAQLGHPAILQVFDVLEAEGTDWIVMEMVEGPDLATLLRKGPLEPGLVLHYGCQIAGGLAAAHAKGIIHRDLKTENVLVLPSGHVKIFDFGLAKTLAPANGDGTGIPIGERRAAHSFPGHLAGTPRAMSPEQTLGRELDSRSDLFAFGVLLYELLTGRSPFQGPSASVTMSRVLTRQPEPVRSFDPRIPPALSHLVTGLLKKDPEDRPQDAGVVSEALARIALEVEDTSRGVRPPEAHRSPEPLPERTAQTNDSDSEPGQGIRAAPRRTPAPRLLRGLTAVIVVTFLAFAAGWWLNLPDVTSGATKSRRTSLAVLPFENTTGTEELDWLRNGLSEMLIVELSQSAELEVLSSRHLSQLLQKAEATKAFPVGSNPAPFLAEQANIDVILTGGYDYLGDTLRVHYRLEDIDGSTLATQTLEKRDQDGVFTLVDELSTAVRSRLEITRTPDEAATVQMITTSSWEAWRLYIEGIKLFHASKFQEAALLLEKAVEIDPGFALAVSDLAHLYRNLSDDEKARELTRRAVEQSERLPLNIRFVVEGNYYASNWTTYEKALKVFQQGAQIFPEESYFRLQIALLFAHLERYPEAREIYEDLLRDDVLPMGASFAAASVYTALGSSAPGDLILLSLAQRKPESWLPQAYIAKHCIHWGRLDEAEEHLRIAFERRPGETYLHAIEWYIDVLRQDWPQAEAAARAVYAKPKESDRWQGAVSSALVLIFQGKSKEALSLLAEAARVSSGSSAAMAHCWAAELRLARGETDQALREAKLATQKGHGDRPELWGLYLTALAADRQGDPESADAAQRTLWERLQRRPNRFEERQFYRLTGLRAGLRGDSDGALSALRRAQSLLPARGVTMHPNSVPDHVPLWVELGEAELNAGHHEAALPWLLKAATSGIEHADSPYAWVRSFFLLGRLHQELGQEAEARRFFQRFLDLWQGGDLAREQVDKAAEALAQKAVSGSPG